MAGGLPPVFESGLLRNSLFFFFRNHCASARPKPINHLQKVLDSFSLCTHAGSRTVGGEPMVSASRNYPTPPPPPLPSHNSSMSCTHPLPGRRDTDVHEHVYPESFHIQSFAEICPLAHARSPRLDHVYRFQASCKQPEPLALRLTAVPTVNLAWQSARPILVDAHQRPAQPRCTNTQPSKKSLPCESHPAVPARNPSHTHLFSPSLNPDYNIDRPPLTEVTQSAPSSLSFRLFHRRSGR